MNKSEIIKKLEEFKYNCLNYEEFEVEDSDAETFAEAIYIVSNSILMSDLYSELLGALNDYIRKLNINDVNYICSEANIKLLLKIIGNDKLTSSILPLNLDKAKKFINDFEI